MGNGHSSVPTEPKTLGRLLTPHSVPRPEKPRCPRCESVLHPRKPDSVARTWALVIAAAVLYVPANYYPVLTVMQLGAGAPSTILGGVEKLVTARQYPLAALVFFASIAVPMMKGSAPSPSAASSS
jgi:paraquat-inducible protein A